MIMDIIIMTLQYDSNSEGNYFTTQTQQKQ